MVLCSLIGLVMLVLNLLLCFSLLFFYLMLLDLIFLFYNLFLFVLLNCHRFLQVLFVVVYLLLMSYLVSLFVLQFSVFTDDGPAQFVQAASQHACFGDLGCCCPCFG